MYAFSLNHNVVGELDFYAEFSGTERPVSPRATERAIDAGFKYLLTKDIQWDIALLKGLAAGSPDWYLTSGLSMCWGQP
jgi:hypothetical protein